MAESLGIVARDALLVGAGGFFGALCRYLVGLGAGAFFGDRLPWGTLLVNVAGSFGLAALLTLAMSATHVPRHLQLVIGTGFFGAFTTFSTFSHETLRIADISTATAALNVGLNVTLCLVAAWLGASVARLV